VQRRDREIKGPLILYSWNASGTSYLLSFPVPSNYFFFLQQKPRLVFLLIDLRLNILLRLFPIIHLIQRETMGAFPAAYRVAQAIGFTGAAWLSGKSWLLNASVRT
jgi:hypothetical protein